MPVPQTTKKYICALLAVCCLGLPIIYTRTDFFYIGVQNKVKDEVSTDDTIFDTATPNEAESMGEAALFTDVYEDAKDDSQRQSMSFLHRRVDPRTLDRRATEKILQDSIELIHLSNFIKPPNESCEKRPPSVIIIGVQKSGTRELYDFMHLHPHIQIHYNKKNKNLNYFAERHTRGIRWLTKQMPCSFSNQMTLMKYGAYFHTNKVDVPKNIRKFNASINLILIVREPVARSYSAYTFFKGRYHESFDKLVSDAMKNTNQKLSKLFNMSIYNESMKRWLKAFNLSQILIIEHNEFKQDPASVLVKVEDFLGLRHYITPDMFVYNAATGFHCIKSSLTTTGMACYASNRGRIHDQISRETKSELTDFFKPKNEIFFKMIGKSFDW